MLCYKQLSLLVFWRILGSFFMPIDTKIPIGDNCFSRFLLIILSFLVHFISPSDLAITITNISNNVLTAESIMYVYPDSKSLTFFAITLRCASFSFTKVQSTSFATSVVGSSKVSITLSLRLIVGTFDIFIDLNKQNQAFDRKKPEGIV